MTNSPSVTVTTPTKNRRELLIETMDSVESQSLSDWEHIVVDDGFNDGTAEMVKARANPVPTRGRAQTFIEILVWRPMGG